jgi:hypothetical protein
MAADQIRKSLAAKAEGRVISIGFHVRLTPPAAEPGETDAAIEIGRGLIREAMLMLKNTGEAEGFVVDVAAEQVVY